MTKEQEMKLARCKNNHYYDAEQYNECPFCDPSVGRPITKSEIKKVFRKKGTELIQTKVSDVQVYLQGCLVKRTGSIVLHPGLNEQYITGLTNTAQLQSVRLWFGSDVVTGLMQLYPYIPRKEEGAFDQEDEESEKLKEKLAREQRKLDDLEKLHELWMNNCPSGKAGGGSLSDVVAYMEELPKRIDFLNNEIEKQKKTIKDLLKQAGQSASENEKEDFPCVFVQVWAEKELTTEFVLEYLEENASWEPFYEISYDSASPVLKINMKGNVRQNTGEGWENVQLQLATNCPGRFLRQPMLYPRRVRLRNDTAVFGELPKSRPTTFSLRPSGLPASVQPEFPYDDEEPAVHPFTKVEFSPFSPQTEESVVSVRYKIQGRWSIPMGADETRLDIQDWEIPVKYNYYAFPAFFDEPYLSARPLEPLHTNMIPGNAKVFFDNTYIGEFYLDIDNALLQQNEIVLPLGTDSRIRVEREELKKSSVTSPIASREKHIRKFRITISSNKNETVSVQVKDQIPVSGGDEIIVEPLELSGGRYEKDTGIITWDTSVVPGERVKLLVEYQIVSPKGKKLSVE